MRSQNGTHKVYGVGIAQCGCPVYWGVDDTRRSQAESERIAAQMTAANPGKTFAARPVDGSVSYQNCEHDTGESDARGTLIPFTIPKFGTREVPFQWPPEGWQPNPVQIHCRGCGKWLAPGEGFGLYRRASDIDEEDADLLDDLGGWAVWCADQDDCKARRRAT